VPPWAAGRECPHGRSGVTSSVEAAAGVDVGRVWLIGAGNMGGALLGRWRLAGFDPVVVDPHLDAPLPPTGTPDTIVLAVKPQVWRAVTADLAYLVRPGMFVVSVMAGVTLAALAERFPGATVARAMPNTPAARGQGITGLLAPAADMGQRAQLETLFAAAGATVWLDDEGDFDALTAVSGSGPAYVFAFVEALAAAGEAVGLAPALAARLATATLVGAASLLGDGDDPASLRAAVTSPNGTTAAGLAALMPGLDPLLRDTVAAAAARSRAMAASFT
jgi:pyrroline-5-carboxylate reductase